VLFSVIDAVGFRPLPIRDWRIASAFHARSNRPSSKSGEVLWYYHVQHRHETSYAERMAEMRNPQGLN
jgi:hypothetical protein